MRRLRVSLAQQEQASLAVEVLDRMIWLETPVHVGTGGTNLPAQGAADSLSFMHQCWLQWLPRRLPGRH
jgi:hypothetical protein